MAARSFVAEMRSIVQVYEILSGLLDGPESARRSAEIFASDRHLNEEIERIRRRYEERTGEPLLLRYRGEECRLEKGKIAVISDPTPGREAFGIVVSDLVIDSRMVDYMWARNIFCEPLDQSSGGGAKVVSTRKVANTGKAANTGKVVSTRFGKIELAAPEPDVKWPEVTRTAFRSDTEARMLDRSPGVCLSGAPVVPCGREVQGKRSNCADH